MSRLTAKQLTDALRAEGVKFVKESREGRGWPNNTTAGSFNPHGVMNHHTANPSSVKVWDEVTILWKGRPDLDGPLCHIGLDRNGIAHLVGWDNCNHAGEGDRDVLSAVLADHIIPPTNQDNVDGNPHFWGIEVMNNGLGEKYPLVQIEALVKINAAICRASGWKETSCIHHREWTRRKIDMSYRGPLRKYIKQALAMKPGVWHLPGIEKPKKIGPNVKAALAATRAGLKYATSAKKPGQAARWTAIQGLLKKF